MSILSKKIIELLSKKFNIGHLEQLKFWDKPLSLKLLSELALKDLNGFLNELSIDNFLSDDLNDIKSTLKLNETTNKILTLSNDALNEEIISDLIKKCKNISETNIEEIINQKKDLEKIKTSSDYLTVLEKFDDFLNKITSISEQFLNDIMSYASIALMVYYIIKLLIDIILQADFPSIFRLKYIQRLIRITLAAIWNLTSNVWTNIKDFLQAIDVLATILGISSALYLYNLRLSRKQAEDLLNEDLCPAVSEMISKLKDKTPYDIQTSTLGNELVLKCAISDDDVIVPKEPYETKLDNIDSYCDIPTTEEEKELTAHLSKEIAITAIIENKREEIMTPVISIDSKVTDETIIAKLEGHSVYSPVNGYILSLQPNKIVIGGISDNTEDFLTRNILSLNSKYEELNEISSFIKKWQVISLYPVMMKNSTGNTNKIYDSMGSQFNIIKDNWAKIYERYEKNVKNITGADNIKNRGDNDELYKVKEDIDNAEKGLKDYLKTIEKTAKNKARQTKPKSAEYVLIEYYLFELAAELNIIKEPTNTEKAYRDQINDYVNQRYTLDKFKLKKIADKINELLKDLEKGISIGDWFKKGLEKYKERKRFSDLEDWVQDIADKNKKLSYSEKTQLSLKILYLYDFYFKNDGNDETYTVDPSTNQIDPSTGKPEKDNKQQVIKEGNYISNYFGNLWKRYIELPEEIKEIEKIIEDLAIFSPYILSKDSTTGEQSRIYLISGDTSMCMPKGGFTEADFGNIRYWIRYCTFATLASVANPITGWSTGFITPIGPLKLPTVYIPIKPIPTQYGFIVIGLTITGIWIFPFVLMVNYSTEYAMPLFDPTGPLKKELKKVKIKITNSLKELRGDVLKKYLDKKSKEVALKEAEVDLASKNIFDHKSTRPANTKRNADKTEEWNKKLAELQAPEKSLKLEKYKLEQQYGIVYDAYSTGTNTEKTGMKDPALSTIQASEELIDKQFVEFDTIIDNMNSIITPLPTTLKPNTANFGATLKAIPKPIPQGVFINIAEDINDNINEKPLDKIINKFKINNESLMTGPAVFNKSGYNVALNVAKLLPPPVSTIKKDPFPSYENLKIKNLQWIKFLVSDFVPTGAKTYGFPGMPPFPIG